MSSIAHACNEIGYLPVLARVAQAHRDFWRFFILLIQMCICTTSACVLQKKLDNKEMRKINYDSILSRIMSCTLRESYDFEFSTYWLF